MPTIAGIPTGAGIAGAFPAGSAAYAAAQQSPQAATAAAMRAAQVGFATAAITQLYPGPTSVPGTPPNAQGNVVRAWMDTAEQGVNPHAAERGQPVPLSWWQKIRLPRKPTVPQPVPIWLQSRTYDRGAAAYAPHFGSIPTNPIGAGVFAPYRLPTIAGPGARYNFGAIWFAVQVIPTSMRIDGTIPIETVNALIAESRVGGTYLTSG